MATLLYAIAKAIMTKTSAESNKAVALSKARHRKVLLGEMECEWRDEWWRRRGAFKGCKKDLMPCV